MQSLLDLFEVTKEDLNPDLKKYRLYCDMDGVLSDFKEQFDHLFGMTPDEAKDKYGAAGFWDRVHSQGKGFWATMPWTPGGQKLWSAISKYNPTLLTAPPREPGGYGLDPASMNGKKSWAKSHLSPAPAGKTICVKSVTGNVSNFGNNRFRHHRLGIDSGRQSYPDVKATLRSRPIRRFWKSGI